MKHLSVRQQQVLQATVHHYVDTIEPVGSRTLVQRFGLKASSATVRSTMGALEQHGLLTQPHASAGRIPSPQGYRHYVDCLLPAPGPSVGRLEQELTSLSLHWAALDDLLGQLAQRLTAFTGLMSLITPPVKSKPVLKDLRLVRSGNHLLVLLVEASCQASHLNLRLPSDRAGDLEAMEHWARDQLQKQPNGNPDWSSVPPHLRIWGDLLREGIANHRKARTLGSSDITFCGLARLVAQPEFHHSERLQPLLELMDNHPAEVVATATPRNGVWIGREHPELALEHCSVVQASFRSSGDGIGQVALVGPMRMAYATAMASARSVALHLERLLT